MKGISLIFFIMAIVCFLPVVILALAYMLTGYQTTPDNFGRFVVSFVFGWIFAFSAIGCSE